MQLTFLTNPYCNKPHLLISASCLEELVWQTKIPCAPPYPLPLSPPLLSLLLVTPGHC